MMTLAAAIVMGFVVLCTADITVMMMAEGQAHQVNFYVLKKLKHALAAFCFLLVFFQRTTAPFNQFIDK